MGDDNVVITDSTGHKIEGVHEVDIYIEANEATRVHLTMWGERIDVTGLLRDVKFKCPGCDYETTHECEGRPRNV